MLVQNDRLENGPAVHNSDCFALLVALNISGNGRVVGNDAAAVCFEYETSSRRTASPAMNDEPRRSRDVSLPRTVLKHLCAALPPDEFNAHIDAAMRRVAQQFCIYRVAKQFERDILTISAGFDGELIDGRMLDIHGGMTATPVRMPAIEPAPVDDAWAASNVVAAMSDPDAALTPMSDRRGRPLKSPARSRRRYCPSTIK
jgi:hypothetical protein